MGQGGGPSGALGGVIKRPRAAVDGAVEQRVTGAGIFMGQRAQFHRESLAVRAEWG